MPWMLGVAFLFGFCGGFVWKAFRDQAIINEVLHAMRAQQAHHSEEREQWLRCLLPDTPPRRAPSPPAQGETA